MKIALQYLNDIKGNTQAVQLPVTEWEKVLGKLKKYEQAFKLKTDLQGAFEQGEILNKSREHKQTLKEFLNEL